MSRTFKDLTIVMFVLTLVFIITGLSIWLWAGTALVGGIFWGVADHLNDKPHGASE